MKAKDMTMMVSRILSTKTEDKTLKTPTLSFLSKITDFKIPDNMDGEDEVHEYSDGDQPEGRPQPQSVLHRD